MISITKIVDDTVNETQVNDTSKRIPPSVINLSDTAITFFNDTVIQHYYP